MRKIHDKGGWYPTGDHQNASYTERPQQTHVPAQYGDCIVALGGEGNSAPSNGHRYASRR